MVNPHFRSGLTFDRAERVALINQAFILLATKSQQPRRALAARLGQACTDQILDERRPTVALSGGD